MNATEQARAIWQAGVDAVKPEVYVPSSIQLGENHLTVCDLKIDLDSFERIILVGAGKGAGAFLGEVLKAILPVTKRKVLTGLVIVPSQTIVDRYKNDHVELWNGQTAGRNLPTEQAVAGTQKMKHLLANTTSTDLVIGLFTGGGSALLVEPEPSVSLSEKLVAIQALQRAGAPIHHLNLIRQHLSAVKGGGLARCAQPRRMINLIVSDVISNDISLVASGPTVDVPRRARRCLQLIDHYQLTNQLPRSVMHALRSASTTPKLPSTVTNHLVAANTYAFEAMRAAATRFNLTIQNLGTTLSGSALSLGQSLAGQMSKPVAQPTCWLGAGETTVHLGTTQGHGGRNQETVLAAILNFQDNPPSGDFCFLSGGTDGEDGPTDAAGAWVDADVLEKAAKYRTQLERNLVEHNSYPALQALNCQLMTGLTETNVADLFVGVVIS